MSHEDQGTGYDSGAAAHEAQGRRSAPDTPEMVERVARAICSSDGSNPDILVAFGEPVRATNNTFVVPQNGVPLWLTYVWQARAAIEAMREPTQGMINATHSIMGGGFQNSHSDFEAWQTMIDAALGRKP